MKKLGMIIGLVAILAATPAFAEAVITMTLVGPTSVVTPGSDFEVLVIVSSDTPLSIIQTVLQPYDETAMMLFDVTSTLVSSPSNAYVSPSRTAFVDFDPNLYPNPVPDSIVAMTLHFHSDVTALGDYTLDALVDGGNFGLSSYVFDAAFAPSWTIDTVSTIVTFGDVVIPEPFTMTLLGLVGIGGVVAGRKRK